MERYFFVPDIAEQLRDKGDVDGYFKLKQICAEMYEQVVRQVFELVYYGHFSAEYVETLSADERDRFFKLLNGAREAESEAVANTFKT